MTAIPATLTADTDSQAIALTLERLQARELTPSEVEKDLLLLFDAEIETENRQHLMRYIAAISRKVERSELDVQDAASDIKEMIGFWLGRSSDLQQLLELGAD